MRKQVEDILYCSQVIIASIFSENNSESYNVLPSQQYLDMLISISLVLAIIYGIQK
jgi:hypothetical protein